MASCLPRISATAPSGGRHTVPRATAQSLPDRAHHECELTRYDATPAKSSTHNGPSCDRSHAPQHPAHEEWRSGCVQGTRTSPSALARKVAISARVTRSSGQNFNGSREQPIVILAAARASMLAA